jgi:hypothetical protein
MSLRFAICCLPCCLLLLSGCDQPRPVTRSPQLPQPVAAQDQAKALEAAPAAEPAVPSGYGPARIEILPLTELADAPAGQQGTQLTIYVSLLDAFGSQIKTPGTLRFELYEYVQRSAQAKGQRIAIWPDIDATAPSDNQKYWRDFLRAYEFTLTGQAPKGATYVLQVTCMIPGGKRLTNDFLLRPEN